MNEVENIQKEHKKFRVREKFKTRVRGTSLEGTQNMAPYGFMVYILCHDKDTTSRHGVGFQNKTIVFIKRQWLLKHGMVVKT